MNFDRFRVQVLIENNLGCSDLSKWNSYKQSFEGFKVTSSNISSLEEALREDAIDLYFKGIYSIANGIFNMSHGYYSWSVVKLYYSIFYLLRCSLATRGLAFVKNNGIYTLQLSPNEKPIRRDTGKHNGERISGDHKSTIVTYINEVGDNDILQTNKIDDKLVYDWIMELRNQVNYRERTFQEPKTSYFTEALLSSDTIATQIKTYFDDDNSVYCFDAEHTCIAAPLKLLSVVHEEMLNKWSDNLLLGDERAELIDNMLKNTNVMKLNAFKKLCSF